MTDFPKLATLVEDALNEAKADEHFARVQAESQAEAARQAAESAADWQKRANRKVKAQALLAKVAKLLS